MILELKGIPNPKQAEFFRSTARHTAYGGARGGGKSWAMRRKLVLLALNYPGLNALIMRRTLPELRENHVIPLLKELKGAAKYNAAERVFKFPNGSRLRLGYCDSASDVYQYQGQEYEVIGLEEATHFTEEQMQFLTTCNRTVRRDFSPRMYYTCNPGGIGHGWVKRLFIDRTYRRGERAADYRFIPARIYDNPALITADPEYLRQLENLPEELRRAYLDGDWDVLAGQFFREFSRAKHVIEPFELPSWWRRFRSIDWGYNDPCAVLWHAVDGEGRVYTYRELYLRYTRADQVAERIRRESEGEDIAYTVASPDMWQKRGGGAEGQRRLRGGEHSGAFFTLGGAADPRGQFPHCGLAAGAQLPCGRPGRRAAAEDILLLREPDTHAAGTDIRRARPGGRGPGGGPRAGIPALRADVPARGIGGAQEKERPCLRSLQRGAGGKRGLSCKVRNE